MRLTEFYRLSDATFYDGIITLYLFSKPFLDKKVFFEEYEAFSDIKCGQWRFEQTA